MSSAPLRADAERNRRKLLDAARELYAEQGLDVTLDDVARHAGVGTGTAYRRFKNKGELIEALMVERVGELVAVAEGCLDEPDPWVALTAYCERVLALQAADHGLKQIMFSGDAISPKVAAERARLGPIVTELVRRAVDAGEARPDLRPTDMPLVNIMLSTLVDFGRDHEPDLYQRYLAIMLDGLRAEGRPRVPLPREAPPIPRFIEMLNAWKRRR